MVTGTSPKRSRDRNPIASSASLRQSTIHHERYWGLYRLPTLQSPYVVIVIICSIRGNHETAISIDQKIVKY